MNTLRVMIVAVGGQGNILAAKLLGEAGLSRGLDVRMSEFHGMAQRGGVVESMVLLGDGKGYCIADGEADILVGFEPCETLRAAGKCSSKTVVITNTAPVPPFTVSIGLAPYPDVQDALSTLATRVGNLIAFDATALAHEAGSGLSLNVVMIGALFAHLAPRLHRDDFLKAIREKTKPSLLDVNLRAFEAGYLAVAQPSDRTREVR
jgi:indolepyruvate ferredoxin oxidoreductase beta subunit